MQLWRRPGFGRNCDGALVPDASGGNCLLLQLSFATHSFDYLGSERFPFYLVPFLNLDGLLGLDFGFDCPPLFDGHDTASFTPQNICSLFLDIQQIIGIVSGIVDKNHACSIHRKRANLGHGFFAPSTAFTIAREQGGRFIDNTVSVGEYLGCFSDSRRRVRSSLDEFTTPRNLAIEEVLGTHSDARSTTTHEHYAGSIGTRSCVLCQRH